jgi:hypothetical protein
MWMWSFTALLSETAKTAPFETRTMRKTESRPHTKEKTVRLRDLYVLKDSDDAVLPFC